MRTLNQMLEEKKKFVPTTGYNVVGVDAFAEPGEPALYLIEHVSTRDAAQRIVERAKADGDRRIIYPAANAK